MELATNCTKMYLELINKFIYNKYVVVACDQASRELALRLTWRPRPRPRPHAGPSRYSTLGMRSSLVTRKREEQKRKEKKERKDKINKITE